MRNAIRIGAAALLGVALLVGAGIGLTHRAATQQPAAAPVPRADSLFSPVGGNSLDGAIASLQERLRTVPGDWQSFASLGLAYVQEARISADPAYYPKAEEVLQRSLGLQPRDNGAALLGMAALAAARHDFADALRFGERARDLNPYDGTVYGVIGDALVELGRYDDAVASFQKMVDTEPGLSSYARVSYARELEGDVRGAITAMRAALEVAPTPADQAWASYQLGELFFNSGRTAQAAHAYRDGTRLDPTFVPPYAGLAKVAWADGDLDGAIEQMADVVRRYPSPEYATLLGDLYAASGDDAAATAQYDLVSAEADLFRTNGVNTDLEVALFEADHGDPRAALAAARQEWDRRHSIHVADALAWALHANGLDAQAAPFARRALAIGTRNALFMAHAGLIEASLGHDDAARALLHSAFRTNPFFSVLLVPVARAELTRLGGSR